jgi:L-alanine-DL-glutamate epimerase-like enolase superfamily enzyme
MAAMRITEVETIVLRLPQVGAVCDGTQDAFVVRILTDEGIAGIGEADSMPTVLRAVFDAPLSNSIGQGLRDLLVGQDPLQIEPLWQRMMDGTLYLGQSGARLTAVSGAEMALWDIAGQALGQPVHALLGGAFHQQVRAYASVLFPEDPEHTAQVRENAVRLRQAGFTAMKFGWGGFGRDRKSDVALVRAAREGAGDDIALMIDVGLCWDLPTALERVTALAEFDLHWLEAPLPHEPVAAYAALCARSPIRIACESAGGFWESLRFLRDGGLHVILPDVSNVGGIGQWKRVAQAAATEGAWCVPHCFSTGILTAASLHLLANQPTPQMIEWSMEGSPLNTSLVRPSLQMRDGWVDVPTTPGLGAALDWDVVERYRQG